MNGKHDTRPVALIAALALSAAALADVTIDWWTIDGGGDMWSAGGELELSGTIGQPDAGVVLTGGDFELTGGFWAAPAESEPQYDLGDVNCDGFVDFFDIDPFIMAITQPELYDETYPDCDITQADCNSDGLVDFFDIDPFIVLITGGG